VFGSHNHGLCKRGSGGNVQDSTYTTGLLAVGVTYTQGKQALPDARFTNLLVWGQPGQ